MVLHAQALAGQAKDTPKKDATAGQDVWYHAIAFDPVTGFHCEWGGADKRTAERNALAYLLELGGKKPAILATTAEKGWAAVAIGQNKSGERLAGFSVGQATADRAGKLAQEDFTRKQGTGSPGLSYHALNKPLKAKVIWVAVAFDSATGAWWWDQSVDRARAETSAIAQCKTAGGKEPMIIGTSTNRGFYAIAKSPMGDRWIAGLGLGLPRVAQAKEAALANCAKNGGPAAAHEGLWQVNATPNLKLLHLIESK
jgi:hypothetical protein